MINKSDVDIAFNDYGEILKPRFHDGTIKGIVYTDERDISFLIDDAKGIPWTIELENVERMCVSDLWEGNIVLSIYLRDIEKIDKKSIYRLYHSHVSDNEVSKIIDRIKVSKMKVLEIVPTYGCALIALFKSFSLQKGHRT